MAPKSKVDCTQEILEFRRILSAILWHKLFDLDKELTRIGQILNPQEEVDTPVSQPTAQEAHVSTSDFKVIGRIDLTQFDPKNAKKRERIKSGSTEKVHFPSLYLSPQEASECYPERKALIEYFIKNASVDREYVQDFFLLRSALRFAVIKKEISDLNCDYLVIRPYSGSLLTPYEIAEFLVDLNWYEPSLTRDLLTVLSNKYGTLSIIHAVRDNAFKYSDVNERKQAESLIVDMVLGLGDSQVEFSKDICAYKMALDNYVLHDLGRYISVAKRISNDSLSRVKFPLNEDLIESLEFGYGEFSTYPEGKDEYMNVLVRVLNDALKEGYISPLEYAAITGKEIVLSSQSGIDTSLGSKTTDNTRKDDTSTYMSPSTGYLTQAEPIAVAINPQRPTKNEVSLNDNPQGPDNKVVIPPEERLPDSPRRFINDKGAFIKLYEKLVQDQDLPGEMDPDNWCKLFKLMMRDDTSLYKLEWRKSKPMLRCFLEELYRPDKMPYELNNIFITNSQCRLKLSEITFSSKTREDSYRDKFNCFIDEALGIKPS